MDVGTGQAQSGTRQLEQQRQQQELHQRDVASRKEAAGNGRKPWSERGNPGAVGFNDE